MQDFSKCKIGDKLWSIQLGECEVIRIENIGSYPILTENKNGNLNSYSLFGYARFGDIHQSLFFSKPEIKIPTPPKQKKRYWQWRIKTHGRGGWFRCDSYLDENGNYTHREGNYENWKTIEKIKIEDDFIEVEE